MPVVHLIRHGRPEVTGVLVGSSDVPLADEPIAPLALAVDRVYVSPLSRALRTAELLFPNAEMRVVPGLAERALGAWELRTWAEIEAEVAGRDWLAVTPPGGESWKQFAVRVTESWAALPKPEATAVVAHIGVNSVLHQLLAGGDPVAFQQNYLEVVSVALFD